MRLSSLSIVLVVIASVPCAAQDGRVTFELTAGRGTDTPIFQHDVNYPPSVQTWSTRLSVNDERVVGGRIGYHVTPNWALVAEIGHGSAAFHYANAATGPLGTFSTEDQWGPASRTTYDLAVVYRTTLAAIPLSIEPELGAGLRRLTVGTPGAACVPYTPTLGATPPPCFSSQRWERTYSVPGLSAGLGVGYAFAPRVAAQLRGRYAIGRTSTRDGFYEDLSAQYDYAEAPTSQTIRSSQLSIGLRIIP